MKSKIEVQHITQGRYSLYVNNICVGEYIFGKNKLYETPIPWAKQQLKKRIPVIEQNLERLKSEIADLEKEYSSLFPAYQEIVLDIH